MKNLVKTVRRRTRKPASHKTNLDYRPPGYKPSWNVHAICPVCNKRIGEKYMSVMHKGSTDEFHYDCLNEAELRRRLALVAE